MTKNICCIILAILLLFYVLKLENNYNSRVNTGHHNIFWSGGYDSTFMLLKRVIIEKKCVNPIYLNFQSVDGVSIRRQNVNFELSAMKKTIDELHRIGYGARVMPLKIVTYIQLTPEVLSATTKLYQMGYLQRPISQYTHMIQYSLDKNIIIDEGAEKSYHSTSYKMVNKYLNKDMMLDLNQVYNTPLYVIRNLRFPIINLTKHDMLNIAKKYKFDYILRWTKSCWLPAVDGSPCGKCIMCKDRIIPETFVG